MRFKQNQQNKKIGDWR